MRQLFYVVLLLIMSGATTTTDAQHLLAPKTQPQFVNPLPIPSVIDARNGGSFTISINQFEQQLGLIDPETKQPLSTKVWGYNGSYPGPTILTRKDRSVDILWQNNLTGAM